MAPFQLHVPRQSAQGAQCAGPDKDRHWLGDQVLLPL